ncbi:MAG: DUF1971 domain-containing protein, partial [Victivallaceae bacterium]
QPMAADDSMNIASEYPNEPNEVFYDHESLCNEAELEDNSGIKPSRGIDEKKFQHHYQHATLPRGVKLSASSPIFTDSTVPVAILKKHMAPKGKLGFLSVIKGALQFEWEDSGEKFDADCEHPIVIYPERYHHVIIIEPVEFKIDFYTIPESVKVVDGTAIRPGEAFIK